MISIVAERPDAAMEGQAPLWNEIAGRFVDDRECLASFLAMEGAEILEGAKPGNLVNVVNRAQPCGRNLYTLWLRHGEELVASAGLAVRTMRARSDSLLLFLYAPDALSRRLAERPAQAVLRRAGYREPAALGAALDQLQRRIAAGPFPHEVGLFLGYPLKDVAAFMGWVPLPFTCQGPWKIYGDPSRSLALASCHHACRQRMARRVAATAAPLACLRRAEAPS